MTMITCIIMILGEEIKRRSKPSYGHIHSLHLAIIFDTSNLQLVKFSARS